MSANGADASEATSIAGLDLDDELQQLLKEQEEFLKQSKRPAAKVSRVGGGASSASARTAASSSSPATADDGESADAASGPQILGSVIERDVIELNIRNVSVMPRTQANGFPAVQRRGESLFGKRQRQTGATATAAAGTAKPSRFSAMHKAQQQTARSQSQQDVVERAAAPSLDPERAEIDRTNRARLQEMSLDEIRQAQQELMASLDPALVTKLMGKKNANTSPAGTRASAPVSTKSSSGTSVAVGKAIVTESPPLSPVATPPAAPIDLAKIQSEDELRAQAQLLPPDERAKHEWMQSVPSSLQSAPATATKTPSVRKAKLDATTERFGFDGERIVGGTAHEHIPTHSGLFHHGDEPDAAGYTMPELVHLARSTVASQRAMALTTIAKVLRRRERCVTCGDLAGAYPHVLPSDLPITLRIALDDQNYTALGAAVTALHAFVVPTESSSASSDFEGVFGIVVSPPRVHLHPNVVVASTSSTSSGAMTPTLMLESAVTEEVVYMDTSESTEEGDTGGISDEELTRLDPVQGLMNMDIGTRVRFILESIQLPDASASAKMLDILVHVARHSPRAAKAIGTNAKLVKALERQFIASDAVLTLQDGNHAALQLTRKALVLVRTLCQGSRAVASVLIASGVVQSTKGFLAIQYGGGSDSSDAAAAALYDAIQLESLRIWRVLLAYGLDFHCFAYLFPILCGFSGSELVRPSGESQPQSQPGELPPTDTAVDESKAMVATTTALQPRRSARLSAVLFAALEAFCGLTTMHDAQHYYPQLGFFLLQARDTVLAHVANPRHVSNGDTSASTLAVADDWLLVAAALRFLAAAAPLVHKFHLDGRVLLNVLQCFNPQSRAACDALAAFSAPSTCELEAPGREALTAALRFHQQVVAHGLLRDDMDDTDVVRDWYALVQPAVLAALARGVTHCARSDAASTQAVPVLSYLLTLTGDLIASTGGDTYGDDTFVATVYAHGLAVMELLVHGHEAWLHALLQQLLFAPAVLQRVGLFPAERDATAMSRVLVPIYHALLNATAETEQYAQHNFVVTAGAGAGAAVASAPSDKRSCHLRQPQPSDGDGSSSSNLPLPGFWLFCPFSRMEVASTSTSTSSGASPAQTNPTRAESDEMKLIVSATCRYLHALETATQRAHGGSAAAAAWRSVQAAYERELRDEDKLFHLLHVFFAGADVLFDAHVDAALREFLGKFAVRVLAPKTPTPATDTTPTLLYDGMVRNLRAFQRLDPSSSIDAQEASTAATTGAMAFSSNEQLVMTFAEKLVGEFTAASYANAHFARCVTLLLASDFPLAIRKWVWKELADCRLLHALQPFADSNSSNSDEDQHAVLAATFARCAHAAVVHDEQLLQAMAMALWRGHVSPQRGAFAYSVAMHHVTVYLFGKTGIDTGSTMSFSRQQLARELATHAPSALWCHLLSYDPSSDPRVGVSVLSTPADSQTPLDPQRVARVTQHAGLSPEQLAAFIQACES